jgi:hypothetical protein
MLIPLLKLVPLNMVLDIVIRTSNSKLPDLQLILLLRLLGLLMAL